MKVTGHKLREAIKEWELRRDAAVELFDGSLAKFDDETKETPDEVMNNITSAEKAIARLQTVQIAYNLSISVDLGDEKVSLAEAVKRIGGAERTERMWRNAMRVVAPARSHVRNRLMYGGAVAQSEEVARFTITQTQARDATSAASKYANKLRSAIAVANATEVDVTDLDSSLIP